MHIHSYQIHNVLNVYRKQLSQGTVRSIYGNPDKSQPAQDRINISIHGQRQSLFDKISSEIVERITRFGPDTEFEAVLADQMTEPNGTGSRESAETGADGTVKQDTAFTYTVINEHNQKITHKLPIRQLNLPNKDMISTTGMLKDNDNNSESE